MRDRRLLAAALAALALAACGRPERPGTPPRRVLLLTVEALRADHDSTLGYERATTRAEVPATIEPPLDLAALADAGVLFANAFAPAPDARAGLAALLGEDAGPRLAEAFRAAGWRTAAFLAPSPALDTSGLEAGFERFELAPDGAAASAAALAWAAELAPETPALFWLHLGEPAPPHDGPPLEDPWSAALADELDRYDGELAHANAAVAELLAAYRELPGPLEQTLIVWAGTHGAELPGEAERGAAVAAEGRLRVPLALSHPPSLTGRRIVAEPVELADLPATLVDWFRLPAAAPGRPLLALLDARDERGFERRPALAAWDGLSSLRTAEHRLLARADGLEPLGLAHVELPGPPRELALEEQPELVAALRALLEERLAAAGRSRP